MEVQGLMTLPRFIIEEEKKHPEATGELSALLSDLALAAKVISLEVNKAGLVDILGLANAVNVHGEDVKKLDMYAHHTIVKAMDHGGHLCVMASEEEEGIIPIPPHRKNGKYVMLFDPLDGIGILICGIFTVGIHLVKPIFISLFSNKIADAIECKIPSNIPVQGIIHGIPLDKLARCTFKLMLVKIDFCVVVFGGFDDGLVRGRASMSMSSKSHIHHAYIENSIANKHNQRYGCQYSYKRLKR